MEFLYLTVLLQIYYAAAEIRSSVIVNRLANVQPVGAQVAKSFVPLTEIPPPKGGMHTPHGPPDQISGRRHLQDDCKEKPKGRDVVDGPRVDIFQEYYDDKQAKTLATIIFPDHIDHKHFEVTSPLPYLTVGPIDPMGYHPSTMKSEHPSECEKIYQDHLDEQYTDESRDASGESLEMARLPLMPSDGVVPPSVEDKLQQMYSDLDV
ncbi:hypothetical protein PYW08_016309 [Mythimna loreyi]|uniref:Uncharacterized protein n=1 Tax=Mythimna loreyi TaxID=667449 RepID=A0ACC2R1U8_9NEOP|nr:hypothetical protein PYW08_016309 [Mythimna loreyi]